MILYRIFLCRTLPIAFLPPLLFGLFGSFGVTTIVFADVARCHATPLPLSMAVPITAMVVKSSTKLTTSSSPAFSSPLSSTNVSLATFTALPVTTISSSHIAHSYARGQTLTQVLTSSTPGLQVSDLFGDGSRAVLGMRGFGENANANTLVLLDGVPYVNPDAAAVRLNFLTLADVERVEVMEGSAAVLYGDQAVGGAVNIVTRRPRPHEASAIVTYGSFDTRKAQVTLGNTWGETKGDIFRGTRGVGTGSDCWDCLSRWGARISAEYDDTDNYRRQNHSRNNAISVTLDHHSDLADAALSYRKNYQNLQMPGALTWQQVQDNPRQAINASSYNAEDSDWWQLNVMRRLSDKWHFIITPSVRYMRGNGAFNVGQNAASILTHEERNAYALQLKLAGEINVRSLPITTLVGTEYAISNYALRTFSAANSATSYTTKSDRNDAAFYGQISVPLLHRLTLLMGARVAEARYSNVGDGSGGSGSGSNSGSVAEPYNRAIATAVELSWRANACVRYYLRRATSFRFPKVDEEALTLARQPLETQTGVSYEGGVVYSADSADSAANSYCVHNGGDKKLIRFALQLHQLDLQQEIMAIPALTSDAKYFVYNTNLDPTRRRGITLDTTFIPLMLLPQLTMNASYNFVDARFNTGSYANKRVPFVAQHSGRIAATYTFNEHWYASFASNFTGWRYPINDVENRAPPVGGVVLHDVSCGYSTAHYDVTLRINNLTNQLYYGYVVATYTGVGQGNGGGSGVVSNSYYPLSGTTVLLTLSVRL